MLPDSMNHPREHRFINECRILVVGEATSPDRLGLVAAATTSTAVHAMLRAASETSHD